MHISLRVILVLEARQQSEDPFGAGSTRECGFREGGNGVGRHLSRREKLGVPTRASLAALSVVQTILSVARSSSRRGTSSL